MNLKSIFLLLTVSLLVGCSSEIREIPDHNKDKAAQMVLDLVSEGYGSQSSTDRAFDVYSEIIAYKDGNGRVTSRVVEPTPVPFELPTERLISLDKPLTTPTPSVIVNTEHGGSCKAIITNLTVRIEYLEKRVKELQSQK